MASQVSISFLPQHIPVTCQHGETVWDAAMKAGIYIRGECNGKGVCGKCHVIADPPDNLYPPDADELKRFPAAGKDPSNRLACKAKPKGPVAIQIPDSLFDDEPISGKTDIAGDFSVSPMVKRFVACYPDANANVENTPAVFEKKITKAVEQSCGQKIFFRSPKIISGAIRPESRANDITLVFHHERGVTSVYPGKKEKSLGLALDIGTTTIAMYVCDMITGCVLFADAVLNPQRRYGEDVISRIEMADQDPTGLKRLQSILIQAINALIQRSLSRTHAAYDDIDEITVVGNTVMQHVFAGVHPHPLGIWPYMPVSNCFQNITAKDAGLSISPETNIYIFPVVSGFVGGDTLAAVLAESDGYPDDIRLIIDIGTNGEIVLMTPKGIWATSCATGPAFEGGHLFCGMRASPGAIYSVLFDPSDFQFICHTIGEEQGVRPIGICGSGVIDAMAVMLKNRMVLPNGRLNEKRPNIMCDTDGLGNHIIMVDKKHTGTGNDIVITLGDIRQIQLAKAAMAVGIDTLLKRAGITRVDTTVLTGAFGVTFDWKHACDIGMFPECVMESRVEPKINLAGIGSIKALLDRRQREKTVRLQQQIHFIDLSTDAEFSSAFPAATQFPDHT